MPTFLQRPFIPEAIDAHIIPSVSDTYDLGRSSDLGALRGWRQVVTVRLTAGQTSGLILLRDSDSTLRGTLALDDTNILALYPATTGTGSIGLAANTFGTGFIDTLTVLNALGLINLIIPTIAVAPAVQGNIWTTGTGVAMRLFVADGVATRQFVPDV